MICKAVHYVCLLYPIDLCSQGLGISHVDFFPHVAALLIVILFLARV